MNKKALEVLREFDNLVLDIMEMPLKVRIDDSPFREATDYDRLELLREEWFKVTAELEKLGEKVIED